MIFNVKDNSFAVFGNTIDDVISKLENFQLKYIEAGEKIPNTSEKISNSLSLWWNGNREGYIEDVDSYIPKINETSAKIEIESLKEVDKLVKSGATTWQTYYNKQKDGRKYIARWGEATQGQIRTAEDLIAVTDQEREKIISTNKVIEMSGAKAKAASVGMKAFAMAGNMLVMWVVTKGIELAVKGLDNWIHKVEKANEAMDNAVSEYESAKSNLKSITYELEEQNKKIDDLLAKDKLTYAEKGQLKELQAITKELLLQQDIDKRRTETASKEAADQTVDAYKKQYGNYDFSKDALNEKFGYENFPMPEDEDDILGNIAAYVKATELLTESQKEYQSALKNGEDVTWLSDDVQYNIDFVEDISQMLDNNLSDLQEKRIALEEEYNKAIQKRQKSIEPLTSSEQDIITTYESIYDVIKMVYEYTNQNSWNDIEIENIFNTKGIEKTKEELVEMAKAGKLTPDMITSYKTLNAAIQDSEIFLRDGQTAVEAFCNEIYACTDTGNINYNNVRQQLMDSVGLHDGINSASDAQLWNEFSKLDSENLVLDAYLQVVDQYGSHPEGWNADDWLFHIQSELENSKLELNAGINSPPLSQTIDHLNTRLKPAMDSLSSAWQDVFTKDGFTLENVDLDMINSIISAKNELDAAGLNVDASAFENIINTLSDPASVSNPQKVQQAFNDVATSVLYNTEVMDGLNGSTAQLMTTMLESLGITNAREIVESKLAESETALAYAEATKADAAALLTEADKQVITSTQQKIQAYLSEAGASEAARLATFHAIAAEQIFGNTKLNYSEKIQELNKLAQAYLTTAQSARLAAYTKGLEKSGMSSEEVAAKAQEYLNQMMGETLKINVDYSGLNSSASSDASSAADTYLDAFEKELSHLDTLKDHGKIAEKEYLDSLRALYERYFKDKKQYTEEYAKYERQYLEGMKSLYDSALSGLSKLMDSKIDGYEHAKDTAIEGLEAEKEAAESAYQAQIDAIQEQIDAIDDLIDKKEKQIDAINEEIDKIKEASEARKRSLDLQKAEYELERMQNQRTQLIFDGEQLVYRPDESGIRDARENLTEIQEDMQVAELEKKISLIEKEIDLLEEQKAGLGKQQDAIREMLDSSNKYYEDLIKQTENYYDTMIKNLESQKARYQELAGLQETAEAYSAVEQVFGSLGYSLEDVLNGSDAAFEDFKAKYIDLISSINNNPVFAEGLAYAADIATDSLGSFHDITQETVAGINNLSSSASTLVNDTDGLAANLEQISSDLSNIPVSEGFSAWVEAFTNLGAAIKTVAGALGIGEDGTVGGLVEALESLNSLSLGNENEADNEENTVVKKFLSLKSAVHDVIAAISGDQTGESKENDSTSSSPSMSDGATGSGGLIGAINSLKTTADDVLGSEGGQKNSEKSTGVIGQFGVLKATVENTAHAIGSNQKNNKPDEENTGTLIDSITELGKKTEETLTGGKTGDKENSVIGRFEAFKNVIGEANEHITGISKGLEEIDGQNAECTIRVKIEASGNFSDQLENVPELTATGMNLESAEYRAVYKGNHLSPSPQIKSPLTSGRTLIPLSAAEPEKAQMYTAFQDYLMTAGSKNTALERQTAGLIKPASQTLTANINTKQQNPPPIQIGDISFTCTGVTGEQVMQQIENQFQGLFLNAYQKSMIRN